MKSLKKEMDKIKVESYKDCVWYIEEADKCKLPGLDSSMSECFCKDKENMEEFCIWVTKFFKAFPTHYDDLEFECTDCECGACTFYSVNNPSTVDFNKRLKEDSYSDIAGRFLSDIKKKISK